MCARSDKAYCCSVAEKSGTEDGQDRHETLERTMVSCSPQRAVVGADFGQEQSLTRTKPGKLIVPLHESLDVRKLRSIA